MCIFSVGCVVVQVAQQCVRERRRGALLSQKTAKETLSRARRLTREMLSYWKRFEKVEREHRKIAVKEAQEQHRLDLELMEVTVTITVHCRLSATYTTVCLTGGVRDILGYAIRLAYLCWQKLVGRCVTACLPGAMLTVVRVVVMRQMICAPGVLL